MRRTAAIALSAALAAAGVAGLPGTAADAAAAARTTQCHPGMFGADYDNLWVRHVTCDTGRRVIRKAHRKAYEDSNFHVGRYACTAHGFDLIVCTHNRKWIKLDDRE
jgi:hypothetical protein